MARAYLAALKGDSSCFCQNSAGVPVVPASGVLLLCETTKFSSCDQTKGSLVPHPTMTLGRVVQDSGANLSFLVLQT